MKRKRNLDELRWVRLFTSSHIPRYLVEQIAKREYKVDDLYTYLEANVLKNSPDGPTLNPLFHIWALVNPENLVKGFLWFAIDPLTLNILIQVYSVDSNYWGSKEAIQKLVDHLRGIRKKAKLKKVYWVTKFPKHSAKHGFKSSDCVLMEYDEEKEKEKKNGRNDDGNARTNGPADTGAAAVSE